MITIDVLGYTLIARDDDGRVLATRKTNCNPAALAQLICDAEQFGAIDWENSMVAQPEFPEITPRICSVCGSEQCARSFNPDLDCDNVSLP